MSAQPWMKFFPTNWRADPALRMCSIGARGLWMEMLCVMHEAEPRGALLINGRQVSPRQLASLAGIGADECVELLRELETAGVFSVDDEGTIVSRRMRREAEKAEEGRRNGLKGGNPNITPTDNPSDDDGVKAGVNPQGNPYMASGISEDQHTQSAEEGASTPARDAEFSQTFWPEYPHKVGKPAALRAFIAARKRADLAAIMAGLARYVREKPPDRPWLNPATFLNQDRFNDEPASTDAHGKPHRTTNAEQSAAAMARVLASLDGGGGRQADAAGTGDGDAEPGFGDRALREPLALPARYGTG